MFTFGGLGGDAVCLLVVSWFEFCGFAYRLDLFHCGVWVCCVSGVSCLVIPGLLGVSASCGVGII